MIMDSTRERRPQKLAEWRERLAHETIFVPPNRGALWTGIGAETAQYLARSMGLITLEMTPLGASLDRGALSAQLKRDFGDTWIAEKRLVFKMLSVIFVKGLMGQVTVFLPEGMARPANGAEGSFAYNVKILWDEMKEVDFGDPRLALHMVTSVRVCWVRAKQVCSETLMSASKHVH